MGMLTYTIDIKASKEKVWKIMFDEKTYREWTAVFHEGSYFEGSWDEGSNIRFLAMDEGKLNGMFSRVIKNTPYEHLSLEHLGEIRDGREDTTSESAREWVGAHENYSFSEDLGITTLVVSMDGAGLDEKMKEMFEGLWPPALAKLKEMAE